NQGNEETLSMFSQPPRAAIAASILMVLCAAIARADEVIFNNGDRLTGKIEMMDGGKMKIKSKIAGEVTVKMEDVKTFSSDEPVTLKLEDGTVLKQKVAAAGPGEVQIQPGGPVQQQNVKLASVKKINPQESWTGAITVGGLLTRGNSDTEQLNVAIDAQRRT